MTQASQGHGVRFQPGRGGRRWRPRAGALLVTAATMVAGLLVVAAPAQADITVDQAVCRNNARGRVSLSESSALWGDSIVISWHTTVLPEACRTGAGQFFLRGLGLDPDAANRPVAPNGSMTLDAA